MLVADFKRFAIHDGPGIRTTVFFKGCPLSCLWCHNPESISFKPQLAFVKEKCIKCGACVASCPQNCHKLEDSKHDFDRTDCIMCGSCTEICPSGVLYIIGEEYSADQLLEEVLKDKAYFKKSGGGITISGGEPLVQSREIVEFLKKAKKENIHICLETSGYSSFDAIERLLPYVDLFLFDLKETDGELHKKYTGVSNDIIIKNLLQLDKTGVRIVLRCPIIPQLNDRIDHLKEISSIAGQMQNLMDVELLAYHPYGHNKAEWVGRIQDWYNEKAMEKEYRYKLQLELQNLLAIEKL